ncbi:MAG: hypothetical protein LBG43_09330 [Treponema sp.]|jgi:predicted aspartyl protease|nr:hypothetical protein [Treponema sp.]
MYKKLLILALFILFSYTIEAEVLGEISFTVSDGKMLVFGTVNNVTGFYAIDTGATDMLLFSPVSNLEAAYEAPFEFQMLGETFNTMRYKVDTIYLGNVTINGTFSVIKPPEHIIDLMPKETRGIINPCVFNTAYVEFSFSEKKIKFHDSLPENYNESMPYTSSFPLPYVKIEIGGNSYVFLIDTGSNGTISFPDEILSGIDAKNTFKVAVGGAVYYKEYAVFKSAGFSLFGHTYNNVVCETNRLFGEEVGVIGLELLQHYDIVFDPFESELYYSPLLPDAFYNMFFRKEVKRSGLTSFIYNEEGVAVTGIAVGSPAWKAGLRPGHIITKINSYDAGGVSKDYAIRIFSSNDPVKIEYKDESGAKKMARIKSKLLIRN